MKSKRLLGFLVASLIASMLYGYLQMPHQERVTAGDAKVNPQTATKKKEPVVKSAATVKGEGYPRLRTDLLERKSQPYSGVHRDLFFAEVGKNEEGMTTLPEELPEVIVPPVVVAVAPPLPPTPQEVARQELSRYKFVGFFKKGEKQTIFLSAAGEIFLVRKGDYLGRDRKYSVVNITDSTLELHKDGAGDFSIKLTDQESLSAVSLPGQRKSEAPGASGRQKPEQEISMPDHPELLPVPDEEPKNEDQLQPEED